MKLGFHNCLAGLLLCLLSPNSNAAEALQWHVLHSLLPALPQDPSDDFLAAYETPPRLSAAWGERESLYLFLSPAKGNLRGATLSAGAFIRKDGETLDSGGLSFRWCGTEGEEADGQWPRDVDAKKGCWARLDWRAPQESEAGLYAGAIDLRYRGGAERMALTLEIWPFDLPYPPPVERGNFPQASTFAAIALGETEADAARVTPQPRGDLPGPGAGALAVRVLPLAARLAGISRLSVEGSDPSFEILFEDGLDDLSYWILLGEDASPLAERLRELVPVYGPLSWGLDPARLLRWRLAAGSHLAGQEGIALKLVREMEALGGPSRGEGRPLLDAESPAWGWKGARDLEVREGGALAMNLDAKHPVARFSPRLGDWRRDGFLEMEIELEAGPPAAVQLSILPAGFRRSAWTFRMHLRPGPSRTLLIPLPRGEIELGRIRRLELRLLDAEAPRSLVIRGLRLR